MFYKKVYLENNVREKVIKTETSDFIMKSEFKLMKNYKITV